MRIKFLGLKFLACAALFCAVSVFAVPELRAMPQADSLNVWVIDNGSGAQKALKKILGDFQKESGAVIKIKVLDWNSAFDEIAYALSDSAASYPDVVQLGSTWVPYFASAGGIRPLGHLLDKVDSSRFMAVGMKAAHIGNDPKVYSMPWFLDVRGLYVNERIWRTLEINESNVNTFEAFRGTLREVGRSGLTNSHGRRMDPFALPSRKDWTGPQQMAPAIWGYGGDFVFPTEGGYRSGLLDSATLKGLAVYAAILGDKEIAPHSLTDNSAENAFRFVHSEQLMVYGTSELIRQLEFSEKEGGLRSLPIAGDGVMMIPFPAGPAGKFAFVGGSHLALSSKASSSRRKLADRLLVYLLRADNLDAYSRRIGFLPSDQSLVRIWFQDVRYSQLIGNLENGRSFLNIPEWVGVNSVLISMANDMGETASQLEPGPKRNAAFAKLVLDADRKINSILKADTTQALSQSSVESMLADVPPEVKPSNLNLLEKVETVSRKQESLVIRVLLGVAFLLMVVRFAVVFIMRRKRK